MYLQAISTVKFVLLIWVFYAIVLLDSKTVVGLHSTGDYGIAKGGGASLVISCIHR